MLIVPLKNCRFGNRPLFFSRLLHKKSSKTVDLGTGQKTVDLAMWSHVNSVLNADRCIKALNREVEQMWFFFS